MTKSGRDILRIISQRLVVRLQSLGATVTETTIEATEEMIDRSGMGSGTRRILLRFGALTIVDGSGDTSVTNTAPHDISDIPWFVIGSSVDGSYLIETFQFASPEIPFFFSDAMTVVDDEGNPCVFSITDNEDISINDSGLFAQAPLSYGAHNFTLRATDPGGLYIEQEFTITVTP